MSTFTRILATFAIVAFSVGPVSAATVSNASTLVAQNASTGTVKGTVTDESGAPVPDATVTLRGATTTTLATDAKGAFSLAAGPGEYSIVIAKNGYETASEPSLLVFSGETQTLQVTLRTRSFQNLRTIASVRSVGRGVFNSGPAAVNTISAATIQEQAQPQVYAVLNQTPGIVASLPQSSANAAAPGAITFPNIRGALSFETASLIDGHPVSVGQYGDYVTTFLNAYALSGIEIVRGPGAESPQVNYAIGGTVNFTTKDPTFKPEGQLAVGYNNHGGLFGNIDYSNTLGRFGFVLDFASNDDPGPFNNYQAFYSIGGNQTWIGKNSVQFNDSASVVPGTNTKIFNQYGLIACCQAILANYQSNAELLKLRYKFSEATTGTFTYLGSQTFADQNANTSSQIASTFVPGTGAAYTGSIPANSPLLVTSLHPGDDQETNNEPILQGDIRTLIGGGTLLGRYYAAGIHRLINQGGNDPTVPYTVNQQVWGTNCGFGTGCAATAANTFNGQSIPVTYYNYYRQSENDALNGWSLEYTHPFGRDAENSFTFSYDQTNSTTTSYSVGASTKLVGSAIVATPSFSTGIPTGSGQLFGTFLARANMHFNSKLDGIVSLYQNSYRSTYPVSCTGACAFDGSNALFQTTTRSHFDPRVSLTYRPTANLALRFSAGSAIAPPYLNLLATPNGTVAYKTGNNYATQSVNAGGLLPETAFGYDLGGSYRFKDGVTYASADLYTTTLYNHFISQLYNSGTTCTPAVLATCPAGGVPIYYSGNVNLNLARYQGVEFQVRRIPNAGFGYTLSGATMRGYAYNLPPCFYSTTPGSCNAYNTNVAIVSNLNFNGGTGFGPVSGQTDGSFAKIGFSNQNIPYLMGYAELNYTWRNGAKALLGETLYGKNNSLNRPPFAVGNVSVIYPVRNDLKLQVSGYNIFNAYTGLFPTWGGQAVAIPLANGTAGATEANVLGPAQYRFVITKSLGSVPPSTP